MTNNTTNTDFIGLKQLPYNTQISELRDGLWQFIDPESLPWVKVKDYLHEYQSKSTFGIVKNTFRLPDQFSEKVNPGEFMFRDSSQSVITYGKKGKNVYDM